MVFTFALMIILGVFMAQVTVSHFDMLHARKTNVIRLRERRTVADYLLMLFTVLCGAWIICENLPGVMYKLGFVFGYFNFSVPLFLCMGLSGSVAYGKRLLDLRQASFKTIGFPCVVFIASTYMVFACVDHYWFYRGSTSDVVLGLTNPAKDQDELKGCKGLLIMRYSPLATKFRCQTYSSAVFGTLSKTPFMPWPDFGEGMSVSLSHMIQKSDNGSKDAPQRE